MVGVGAPGLVLGREHQHGDAVDVGLVNAGHQVDGAGPHGAQADPGLAGKAGVGVGHVRRRLLVAGHDEVDALLSPEADDAVSQGAGLRPRYPEDVAHLLLDETLNHKTSEPSSLAMETSFSTREHGTPNGAQEPGPRNWELGPAPGAEHSVEGDRLMARAGWGEGRLVTAL